ncbi:error-prone DNA polymerase [Pseudothauera rhizosphaerae]|uniref:Error-prone DNA polymerase n=1 Tax=Pseudothauera rhizosphaerae TaxID=2565932 RepID=A0A4S4AGP6_9RHOO|nr:error-prone DNA polymerase [Pseudothauera rhizosphaerae]THF58067.1 error-prone DNA polymerase [Pseudothauera rhizosphaerae]
MTAPAYAELHCLSCFSFLHGASHPEELVQQAAAFGYRALAITDEGSLAGVVRAHREIRRQRLPLKLIVGSRVRLADGPALVLLAATREGYAGLCRLLTRGRRAAPKGQYRLARADLADGLPGCLALLLPPDDTATLAADLPQQAAWLTQAFPGRAWIAADCPCGADDRARLQSLQRIARETGLPLVAATGALMHDAGRRELADVLTAIRLRTPLAEAGLALAANAERRLHDPRELARRLPAALLAESVAVAERCAFSLAELRYEYPAELVPPGESAASWLRRLVEGGLAWRYAPPLGRAAVAEAGTARPPEAAADPAPPKVRALVEYELALIADLGYEPYFLTVHDIVRHARQAGILCQGRGSAANSVVCWALGITEVHPEQGVMLIERFISRERDEPPDIDVDFEHDRREEVIQYLYRKYGRERAALAATVISYRSRSALRDVGRALGLDEARIERLTRGQQWFDGRQIRPERLREAGLDPASPVARRLTGLVHTLLGFPRHLSQHVGGFVIARGRVDELVPVENAAMDGRTVIQWDKDDLDEMGLLKVDVLALGMLSALRRSLELLSAWEGRSLTLADIPREDPAVYDMLGEADAIGVFQVESRAQLSMLPRLKPSDFYDLVVEVAIVRPGPIQGGMVHPYLGARERKARGEDPLAGLREEIRPVLERTLGVPIFQEQVMQLAVAAAGFTPGESDQLRRAMGTWRGKGELDRYREKLMAGMAANDYSDDFAERLCRQIEGFGSYGFPESHAASFALLVYCSAWIKRFHPAAFLCGLLNSQPMGFYSPSQLIQDARRHGVEVLAPDVCHSQWHSVLAPSSSTAPAVRLGLERVKGFNAATAERIVAERACRPFADVADLADRAALSAAELRVLAAGGALASLAGHRRQALWQAAGDVALPGVLHGAPRNEARLALPPATEAQDIVADYARLGFTLGRHPLALLRERLAALRFLSARQIADCQDRQLARAAGVVTCRQRPGTAKGTLFVTLEDETGLVNIIVRPELLEAQRRELLGARLLGVYGQISRQGRVVHLVAGRVVDHSVLLGSLEARSRDFH